MGKPTKEERKAAIFSAGARYGRLIGIEGSDHPVVAEAEGFFLRAIDAALERPAEPSDLRRQIEAAVDEIESAAMAYESDPSLNRLAEARADLSTLLDALDKMAERDALWGRMTPKGGDWVRSLSLVFKGGWHRAPVWVAHNGAIRTRKQAEGATPLAAVQALVAKIEEEE